MDQGDINAMDNIEGSIAEESMVISDEDIDDEEDVELEDDTDYSSDSGEERTAMTAINESDQDIIMVEEGNVEPKDEVEQNSNAEENSMGSMMEREGVRRKTGESRYDAIVLDDLD